MGSGVIVSEAHSYVDTHSETEDLLRILYRCSQFTPEQCGMDPTAIRLRKGSCGWGQMKAAGVPFSSDLDESVRRIALVEVPPNFQHPEANPLPSPLLVEGNLSTDLTSMCHQHSHSSSCLDILPTFRFIRRLFDQTLDDDWPRYVITLDQCKFLVARPHFGCREPTSGRPWNARVHCAGVGIAAFHVP